MAKLSLTSVGDQDLFQRVQWKHSFYQLQIWLHCLTLVLSLVLFKILKKVVNQPHQPLEPMELLGLGPMW